MTSMKTKRSSRRGPGARQNPLRRLAAETLEPRLLLSSIQPLSTKFKYLGADRSLDTVLRFDGAAQFVRGRGPEAGMHTGGLLGGGTSLDRIVIDLSEPVDRATFDASDVSIFHSGGAVSNPIRIQRAVLLPKNTNGQRIRLVTTGELPGDAGATLSVRLSGMRSARSGQFMAPTLQSFRIHAAADPGECPAPPCSDHGNGNGNDGKNDGGNNGGVVDATLPPQVVSISPDDGAVLLSVPARVAVTFSRDLLASSINTGTFRVTASGGDGVFGNGNDATLLPVRITYDQASDRAVFTLPSLVSEETYQVRLVAAGGISDTDGRRLDGNRDGAGGDDYVTTFRITTPASPDAQPGLQKDFVEGEDPIDRTRTDTFGRLTPQLDLASIGAFRTQRRDEDLNRNGRLDPFEDLNNDDVLDSPELFVNLRFDPVATPGTRTIEAPSAKKTNSVFGFIDLDIDQNQTTGTLSNQSRLGRSPTSGLGIEFFVDLGSEARTPGEVEVVYTGRQDPVIGNWDGTGFDDIAFYRPQFGDWIVDMNGTRRWESGEGPLFFCSATTIACGGPDLVPVRGAWSGGARDKIGLFDPHSGLWLVDRDGNFAIDPNEDVNGNGILEEGEDRDADGLLDNDGPFFFSLGLAGAGTPQFKPIVGDWNRDGIDDLGVYDAIQGVFLLDTNGNRAIDAEDLDGDGLLDPGEDANGNLLLDVDARFAFGPAGLIGSIPLPGDWDGNGATDVAVFDPTTGQFSIDRDGNRRVDPDEDANRNKLLDPGEDQDLDGFLDNDGPFQFGQAGDTPLVGDWGGDGSDDIGVFRSVAATNQGQFIIDLNNDRVPSPGEGPFPFGVAGDRPIIGRYDLDRRSDIGVYRAAPQGNPFDTRGQFLLDQNANRVTGAGEGPFTLVARAAVDYLPSSLTVQVPLSLIGAGGPAAGLVNFGTVIGSPAEFTDEAPDGLDTNADGTPDVPEVASSATATAVQATALNFQSGVTITPTNPAPNPLNQQASLPRSTIVSPGTVGIEVTFSAALDPESVSTETVQLIAAGGDNKFGDARDVVIQPKAVRVGGPSNQTVFLDLTAVTLDADLYRFVVQADGRAVRDSTFGVQSGIPIDGDFDEDTNGNGFLDANEDRNRNAVFDVGEDLNFNGIFDTGEDRALGGRSLNAKLDFGNLTGGNRSGDGQPGGDFIASFRLDGPPEIASFRLTQTADLAVPEVSDTGVQNDGGTRDTTPTFIGVIADDLLRVVTDPEADTFGPTALAPRDIIEMNAEFDATTLHLGLRFASTVSLASARSATSLAGFVDLDVDQGALTTGAGWLVDRNGNRVVDISEDLDGDGNLLPAEDVNTNSQIDSAREGLFTFGIQGDEPLVGDWSGDSNPNLPPGRTTKLGLYRTSTGAFYLDLNGDGILQSEDRDADGLLDVGEDLNGNGTLDRTEGPFFRISTGTDRLVGDWDPDGLGTLTANRIDEVGVFDRVSRTWTLDLNGNFAVDPLGTDGIAGTGDDEQFTFADPLRVAGDVELPAVGQFRTTVPTGPGDVDTRVATYNVTAKRWTVDLNGDRDANDPGESNIEFGPTQLTGDTEVPVVGDWNGDGADDLGLYRARTGEWFLDLNGNRTLDAGEGPFVFGPAEGTPRVGNWDPTAPCAVPNPFGCDKIAVYDVVPSSAGQAAQGRFFVDFNGNRLVDSGEGPIVFGQGGEDSNENGVLDAGEDLNADAVLALPDIPVVGDWAGTGAFRIGVFRPNGNSHASAFGPLPTSGLGAEYYLDLGSERGGRVDLIDATTGQAVDADPATAGVQGVPIELFPDDRTVVARIPVALLRDLNSLAPDTGLLNYAAIVGPASTAGVAITLTDESPDEPTVATSPAVRVQLERGDDTRFDEDEASTRGFGTFILELTSEDIDGDGVLDPGEDTDNDGRLDTALAEGTRKVQVLAIDSGGNRTVLERGIRVDVTPPRITNVDPANGTAVNADLRTLTLFFQRNEDLNGNGLLDPGEDTNGDFILQTSGVENDLDPATIENTSSYRLVAASSPLSGPDFSAEIRAVDYSPVTDSVVLQLSQNLPTGIYRLVVRGDRVTDAAGVFLDGEYVGTLADVGPAGFPTGNGIEGGDFLTTFVLNLTPPRVLSVEAGPGSLIRGVFDPDNEDVDGDGVLDPGEDRDNDNQLDLGFAPAPPQQITVTFDQPVDGRTLDAGEGAYGFGGDGDLVVSGDWNGDSRTDIGTFQRATSRFFLDLNGSRYADTIAGTDPNREITGFVFDGAGTLSIPVIGDWNSDGRDDVGFYDPDLGQFTLDLNGSQTLDAGEQFPFGPVIGPLAIPGVQQPVRGIPVVGNWDGVGRDEIGVYNPIAATFLLDLSSNFNDADETAFRFGLPAEPDTNGNGVLEGIEDLNGNRLRDLGDTPVIGDWTNDGRGKVGVFRRFVPTGTGVFLLDLNGDRELQANEDSNANGGLNAGEDLDGDRRLDTAEDANRNGMLDAGEDKNGNGLLDSGNEGPFLFGLSSDQAVVGDWNKDGRDKIGTYRVTGQEVRLDLDGNGIFELSEDANGNSQLERREDQDGDGLLDDGEDLNLNGVLDGDEDRNRNGQLDRNDEQVYTEFGLGGDQIFVGNFDGDRDDELGAGRANLIDRTLDIFLDRNNSLSLGQTTVIMTRTSPRDPITDVVDSIGTGEFDFRSERVPGSVELSEDGRTLVFTPDAPFLPLRANSYRFSLLGGVAESSDFLVTGHQPGLLPDGIRENIPVSPGPDLLTLPSTDPLVQVERFGYQGTTSIAQDTAQPEHLALVAGDSGHPLDRFDDAIVVFQSVDGGRNWVSQELTRFLPAQQLATFPTVLQNQTPVVPQVDQNPDQPEFNVDLDGDGIPDTEDLDQDGIFETVNEDANGNFLCDLGEDLDGDGHLDAGEAGLFLDATGAVTYISCLAAPPPGTVFGVDLNGDGLLSTTEDVNGNGVLDPDGVPDRAGVLFQVARDPWISFDAGQAGQDNIFGTVDDIAPRLYASYRLETSLHNADNKSEDVNFNRRLDPGEDRWSADRTGGDPNVELRCQVRSHPDDADPDIDGIDEDLDSDGILGPTEDSDGDGLLDKDVLTLCPPNGVLDSDTFAVSFDPLRGVLQAVPSQLPDPFKLDIWDTSGTFDPQALNVSIQFAQRIQPASARVTNSVFGFIELDTDREAAAGANRLTGAISFQQQVRTALLNPTPVRLGVDFVVDLGSERFDPVTGNRFVRLLRPEDSNADGVLTPLEDQNADGVLGYNLVINPATNRPVDIPIVYSETELTVRVPRAFLANFQPTLAAGNVYYNYNALVGITEDANNDGRLQVVEDLDNNGFLDTLILTDEASDGPVPLVSADETLRQSAVVVARFPEGTRDAASAPGPLYAGVDIVRNVTTSQDDAIARASLPLVAVTFGRNEDLDGDRVLDPGEDVANRTPTVALDTGERFLDLSPSITVDVATQLRDAAGTVNPNVNLVYVPYERVEIDQAGDFTDRIVLLARSGTARNLADRDGDGLLNPGEDLDGDGVLDGLDTNGDGIPDADEDVDGDGVLDPGEDIDGDGKLDPNEDFNGNGVLDRFVFETVATLDNSGFNSASSSGPRQSHPRATVGPRGEVYVVWEALDTRNQTFLRLERSFDLLGFGPPYVPINVAPRTLTDPPTFVGYNFVGSDIPVTRSPASGQAAAGFINGINDQTSLDCADGTQRCYSIPAQPTHGIFANPQIAVDRSFGPFAGRLYVVYTDRASDASPHDDTDIFLRISDDLGLNWNDAIRVNDDSTESSQFNPSIAVDPNDGRVYVTWYDARLDPANQQVDLFMAVGVPEPAGLALLANQRVSTRPSDQSAANLQRNELENGDYTSVVVRAGIVQPAWTDSRALLINDNPSTERRITEILTARIDVGPLFEERPPLPAIRDLLGNALDGEAIGAGETVALPAGRTFTPGLTVGLPSGDGRPSGNFVSGFIVADRFIIADSAFEEDPLFPSEGTATNPFATLERALGFAASIPITVTFDPTRPIKAPSAAVTDPGTAPLGFIDIDTDQNPLTGIDPLTLSRSRTDLLGQAPLSGLGAEFYVDLASEARHPRLVDVIDNFRQVVVGTAPIRYEPDRLIVDVPRNLIGNPDRANFAAIIAVSEDQNRNGLLDPGEDLDRDGRLSRLLPIDELPNLFQGGVSVALPAFSDPLYCVNNAPPCDTNPSLGVPLVTEDLDQDSNFDIGEDLNRSGTLEQEDLDFDFHFFDADGDGLQDANEPFLPETGEDANLNGQLDFEDLNSNGIIDPGEDRNANGVLDTEDRDGDGLLDLNEDLNGNGVCDAGEDLDGDNRFDIGEAGVGRDAMGLVVYLPCVGAPPAGAVFGIDVNGDGMLAVNEDLNNNRRLDSGEDVDRDLRLDINEDLNGDGTFQPTEDEIFPVGDPRRGNGVVDAGEDINQDGRLSLFEDIDDDNRFDCGEDLNCDSMLDAGEDIDGDGTLDRNEDLNGNLDFETDTFVVAPPINPTALAAAFIPLGPVVVLARAGTTPAGRPVPYVIEPDPGRLDGSVQVPAFTTLVFDAGNVVKLRASNIEMAGVGSAIQVRGTALDRVVFTSLQNDSVDTGGDTNGDSTNTTPRGGDWGGLVFRNPADDALSAINFARLEFGGGPVPQAIGPRFDVVFMEDARTAVVNTILFQNGDPRASSPTQNAQAALSANFDSFQDDSVFPFDGSAAGMRGPLVRNLDLINNTSNALWVRPSEDTGRATLSNFVQATWDDPVPYMLTGLTNVTQGAKLFIDPEQDAIAGDALVVKSRFAALQVEGRAVLQVGDAEPNNDPVVFTSFFDDSFAGDTNSDGIACSAGLFPPACDPIAVRPAPGDWAGVFVLPSFTRVNKSSLIWQQVIGGAGSLLTMDEALLRFAGGDFPLGVPSAALDIRGPGYYQVTRTDFRDNRGSPFQVDTDALRADIGFDIATSFVREDLVIEDPLFRDLSFGGQGEPSRFSEFANLPLGGNTLNSMLLRRPLRDDLNEDRVFDPLRELSSAPSETISRLFYDINGDGRLELDDGLDFIWNDTDVTYIVQESMVLPGRRKTIAPEVVAPFPDFNTPAFPARSLAPNPAQEFADLALRVGHVETSSILTIDFELDPFGVPLIPAGGAMAAFDPRTYDVAPFFVRFEPDFVGPLKVTNDAFNDACGSNFARPAVDETVLSAVGVCSRDGGVRVVLGRRDIFGFAFKAINNGLSGNNLPIPFGIEQVVVRSIDDAGRPFTVPDPLLTFAPLAASSPVRSLSSYGLPSGEFASGTDVGEGFFGVFSPFPITEVVIHEDPTCEISEIPPPCGPDDFAIDDVMLITEPVRPYLPVADLPSAVLTLQSLPADTVLRRPTGEVYAKLSGPESLVVKLNGADPAGLNATNVGAGFQVGMDDGDDPPFILSETSSNCPSSFPTDGYQSYYRGGPAFQPTCPPGGVSLPRPGDNSSQADQDIFGPTFTGNPGNDVDNHLNRMNDFGIRSALRILGVPGVEATGQPRTPVILTSLRDDGSDTRGRVEDTNGDGIASAANAGDWGRIFIGGRSSTESDDLLVEASFRDGRYESGSGRAHRQAIPGTPGTVNPATGLPPELDESQGSVVYNADIYFAAGVEVQGASSVPPFGVQEFFGGRDAAGNPFGGSVLIGHNQFVNVSGPAVDIHPGIARVDNMEGVGGLPFPASVLVQNNVFAHSTNFNGPAFIGVQSVGGGFLSPPDAVVLQNTFFNNSTAMNFLPGSHALALNNIIEAATLGTGLVSQDPPNTQGPNRVGFTLFFQPQGVVCGAQSQVCGDNFIDGRAVAFWPNLNADPTLFVDPNNLDFRLRPRSSANVSNPAIDSAISEFGPLSDWANQIMDDIIVRLPIQGSPLGPEIDLAGGLRQDDVRVTNIGAGAKPWFDIGAGESRDFGAPTVNDVEVVLAARSVQVPAAVEPAIDAIPEFIEISVSEDLDPETVTIRSVMLIPAGQDLVFGPDDTPIGLQNANDIIPFDPVRNVITVVPSAPLVEDRYMLVLLGTGLNAITDLTGVRLDTEFPGRQSSCLQVPLPIPCTDPATGYSSGDGFPGGPVFTATFRIAIAPRVQSVTVRDARSSPIKTITPGVDADFPPDRTFQVTNPPTEIIVTFTEDVRLPPTPPGSPGPFRLVAAGPDGVFDPPGTVGDDIVIPATATPAQGSGIASPVVTITPVSQGSLPTNTIWRLTLVGGPAGPPAADAILDTANVQLDGEFFSGNEDRNGNGRLDAGEDRNGNGVLDVGPDTFPSGENTPGGNFVGFFQVGSFPRPSDFVVLVDVNDRTADRADETAIRSLNGCPDVTASAADDFALNAGTLDNPVNTIQEAICIAAASARSGLDPQRVVVLVSPGTYNENVIMADGVTVVSREGPLTAILQNYSEDINLNGTFDSGEDLDGDGRLDTTEDFNANGRFDVFRNADGHPVDPNRPVVLIDGRARASFGFDASGRRDDFLRSVNANTAVGPGFQVRTRRANDRVAFLPHVAVQIVSQPQETSGSPLVSSSLIYDSAIGVQATGPAAGAAIGGQVVGRIENNVIWANRTAGIEVRTGALAQTLIVNNTIDFNNEGIRLTATGGGTPNIAGIYNNIINASTGAGIRSTNTARATIDFNTLFQNLGGNVINIAQVGPNNIAGDPLFTSDATIRRPPQSGAPNPQGVSWRLRAGSPSIDRGVATVDLNNNGMLDPNSDLFAPTVDQDGNGRVDDPATPNNGQGTPPFIDHGAFERVLALGGTSGAARIAAPALAGASATAPDAEHNDITFVVAPEGVFQATTDEFDPPDPPDPTDPSDPPDPTDPTDPTDDAIFTVSLAQTAATTGKAQTAVDAVIGRSPASLMSLELDDTEPRHSLWELALDEILANEL